MSDSKSSAVPSVVVHAVTPPKATLEAVQAIGKIARILGQLSEADQQAVIRALGELK
jgi:hypothetical protein